MRECSYHRFRWQLTILGPPRWPAYALQEPLKEELWRIQRQQIIVPLGVDMTSKWCNSFMLVPKANSKVRLCTDPPRLKEMLIRPVHRCPMLNNILPRLVGVKYFMLIDARSGYHNLKLGDKSYLTTFSCPFGRYQYVILPFGAVPL